MESTRLRAWTIGAIYLVIALAASLIASAQQAPFLTPYLPLLSTIVTVGAVLRAFIDRTLSTVPARIPTGDENPMEAIRSMPGVADAIERGVNLSAPPLPAGPTQLHNLADAPPIVRRNFGPIGTPADDASMAGLPLSPANPRDQRDEDGRFLIDDVAQQRAAAAREAARWAVEEREARARKEAEEEQVRLEVAALRERLAVLENRGGGS